MIQPRHDIVLFLGAGFSAHAGLPVMSQFGTFALKRLEVVRSLARGDTDDGRRAGAQLFVEAGQVWQGLSDLCSKSLAGRLMDANNIEDLFTFVEALREHGLREVRLFDQRYSLDYAISMLRLWIWNVYTFCPVASISKVHLWQERREPYVALASQLEQESLLNRLWVLTTNYDVLFESLLLHETTSLSSDAGHHQGFGTRVDDDDVILKGRERKIPIRKLHGSVDLFSIDTAPEPGPEDEHDGHTWPALMRDMPVRRLLHADRLDRTRYEAGRLAVLQANSMLKLRRRHGESLVPAIAPPSFQKTNRYEWLLHTWRDVHHSMSQVRHMIFVGYSMPATDGYLRGLLASGLAHGGKTPPTIRVLDADAAVIERYRQAFRIAEADRMFCGRFESAESMATLRCWLDEVALVKG